MMSDQPLHDVCIVTEFVYGEEPGAEPFDDRAARFEQWVSKTGIHTQMPPAQAWEMASVRFIPGVFVFSPPSIQWDIADVDRDVLLKGYAPDDEMLRCLLALSRIPFETVDLLARTARATHGTARVSGWPPSYTRFELEAFTTHTKEVRIRLRANSGRELPCV
ncbi:hypothetical protein AAEX63_01815 [Luteococcus sp. H138]|uniref:hypothetical protein n=1 Tax=Luteococcus sp. H138 TaxID=3139404 RepID=UPI00313CCD11